MQIAVERSSPKTSESATRTSGARPSLPLPVQGKAIPLRPQPPAESTRATLEGAFGADVFAAAATGLSTPSSAIQAKAAGPGAGAGARSGPDRGGHYTEMPSPVRAKMEAAFGADFSGVRVHPSSSRATALGALAYTQGSEIHFAPGQWAPETTRGQELLGHELCHLEQRRAGRVQATAQYKGVALNDSPALEAEADAMGARAAQGLSASSSRPVSSRVAHAGPSAPAQLKSILKTVTPKKGSAVTPIETLDKVFGKYYQSLKMAPTFNFHSLGNRQVSNYVATADARGSSTYDKAGEVVADVDPVSTAKADSKNRDNNVINPYGHFGVMERAIFGRQNLGNTYDGGHLVEHTLMEGQDADVHGNIAPQENKHFNQGLMRGWEKIPEQMMAHDKQKFTYTMKVEYSDDSYERTGKQLVDAGVIPGPFFNLLPVKPALAALSTPAAPLYRDDLERESATFERWVPYRWTGKIDVGTGSPFATRSLPHGTIFNNLYPDLPSARGAVVDMSRYPVHTATLPAGAAPRLYRQNSGTLSGVIHGAMLGGKQVLIGSSKTLEADMFQPEPQDDRDQPTGPAHGPSGSTAPAVSLPSTATPAFTANILKNPINFSKMQNELNGITVTTTSGKRKAHGTIESEATKASGEYKKFKGELSSAALASNAEERVRFIDAFRSVNQTNLLTRADVTNVINKARFPAATRDKLHPIIFDPNFKL